MGKQTTTQVLAANLKTLMARVGAPSSAPAVEEATKVKGGLKVGRSTVQRILKAETPVNLDYVESLAKVFGVQPWELLHPSMGKTITPEPDLPEALAAVARHITSIDDAIRPAVAGLIGDLVDNPGTAKRFIGAISSLVATDEPAPEFELTGDAAAEARPATSKQAKVTAAARRRVTARTSVAASLRDLKEQVNLPLVVVSDAEHAEPNKSETAWYEIVEKAPK